MRSRHNEDDLKLHRPLALCELKCAPNINSQTTQCRKITRESILSRYADIFEVKNSRKKLMISYICWFTLETNKIHRQKTQMKSHTSYNGCIEHVQICLNNSSQLIWTFGKAFQSLSRSGLLLAHRGERDNIDSNPGELKQTSKKRKVNNIDVFHLLVFRNTCTISQSYNRVQFL